MQGSGEAVKKLEAHILLVKTDVDALIALLQRAASKSKHTGTFKKIEASQQAQFDKAVAECKEDVADLVDAGKQARRDRVNEDFASRGATTGRIFAL